MTGLLPVILAAALAGCSGDGDEVPRALMDGAPPPDLPVELASVTAPTVLTRATVVDASDVEAGSAASACLHGRFRAVRGAGPVVTRTGVSSASVTFREESRHGLVGCDDSQGPREPGRRWCGASFGRLYGGRLRDPRLDVLCTTANGEPMGFVWVQPEIATRYVAVRQPGYVEVYEVAAGLPVRVATTSGVESEGSRASFELSEHDGEGRLIREYRLEAVVAG